MAEEDEEFDELLEAMERRAQRLTAGGPASLRRTDTFGRMPSILSKTSGSLLKKGDAIGENYEVERVLDERTSSTVVLVRHRFVERLFTIKLLPTELASDADHVARFKDEARATSMIGHENIVFVTDFGRSTRFGFYYVMEYLDGETLEKRLERADRLNAQAALEIALCAGSALAAVHELGIVHRDICPRNLMSHKGDGEETWKLLDFGLSSKVVRAQEAITLYEDPRYVAPEIAVGAEITELADQFSLAAVLYHVLFGEPPWPNRTWTSATPESWTEPETTDDLIREVGPHLRRLLIRALSAAPEDRFPSVDAFVAAFQRASGRSRRATIPPIDIGEATRALAGYEAATYVTIGTTFDSEVSEGSVADDEEFPDPPSVEISLDMLSSARPKITMSFQTAARLRREWRRNLLGGGVFVPTEKSLAPGTSIVLGLRFAPTGAEATFPAKVVEFVNESPCGLAIQLNPDLHEALHAFLYELDLGLLEANTIITPLRPLTEDAELTSDEVFLLSRLPQATTVGRLRAMFTSLPMDLEDVVARLTDKGWISVGAAARKRIASRAGTPLQNQAIKGPTTERDDFVRLTLERADFFRSQGNFMAEIETLQLAAGRYAEPEFHYRIALSRVQFLNDFPGAVEAMRKAVEFAPNVAKYCKALEELEKLTT